jgi:hypothetical protein
LLGNLEAPGRGPAGQAGVPCGPSWGAGPRRPRERPSRVPALAPSLPVPRVFIEQLTRLLAPGGTLILADFCRRPGEPTKKQWKALAGIDKAFASAGNWHSAEQYEALMREWFFEGGGGRALGERGRRAPRAAPGRAGAGAGRAASARRGRAWGEKPCRVHSSNRRRRPHRRPTEANGLEVKATADWTTRLRGFWDLSAAELLLRREPEMAARAQARSALANGLELSKQVGQAGAAEGTQLGSRAVARGPDWALVQCPSKSPTAWASSALLAPVPFHPCLSWPLPPQMMDLSKIVHVAFWSGCFEPFNMCVEGFVFGKNKRVMRHAFGSGALQYRVLVARKPASGAPSKVACPLVFDISAAAASGSGSGSGSTSDSGSASGSRPSDASDASAKRESEISSA